MSSLAFLVTELQVRVHYPPSQPGCSTGRSLYPARRNEGTQKSERCCGLSLFTDFRTNVIERLPRKSLAILRASPEQATANLASGTRHRLPPTLSLMNIVHVVDGPQSDDLLRPVFMGCATKNAKVVAISLGSLHRLISLKAVPQSAVPVIVNTMGDCIHQGVDIQLRILQTLLSLITNFPSVHGELLGDVGHFHNALYSNIDSSASTGPTPMF
jgi:hypothetical protein